MWPILQSRLLEVLILSCSAGVFSISLWAALLTRPQVPVASDGWLELSLPAAIAMDRRPCDAWEFPSCNAPRGVMECSLQGTGISGVEAAGIMDRGEAKHRLLLQGSVMGDAGNVYCFLDTLENRYVWLVPGAVDSATGLRLKVNGDVLTVIDPESGGDLPVGMPASQSEMLPQEAEAFPTD